VNVSLKQGLVSIAFKPGNTVTLQQVRKAIKDDAFTPKDARVIVVGLLMNANGKFEFKVSGTSEMFPVSPTAHTSLDKKVGQRLSITGLISAPSNRNESGSLEITQVSAPPSAH
jgi:hypothetical protein